MLVRIEKKINNNITTYPGEVISVKILEGWRDSRFRINLRARGESANR